MDEIKRITKLIGDHYEGSPWIDVTIAATLKNIPASRAAMKVDGLNSIWQIVNHMTAWREAICEKLKGNKINVTQSNFIEEINDTSEMEWNSAVKKLERSQKDILSFMTTAKEEKFDDVYSNGHTYYEHLQAILQHDAYHLGQIVLLKKLTDV